jgi:streptogramin lyase
MLLSILPVASLHWTAVAASPSRTYTLDADFDEGILIGVEHETVHDQLQLSQEHVTLPFIWVPNQNGTVSKVHTESGKELGRYRVAPHSNCDPSRTTVDLEGNCWVGNRQAGTVVKIGLAEVGQCIDRNDDGVYQTSQDLNDDGNITGGEILPWGEDECVLYEVVLISGKQGAYVPGAYGGGYDYDYWGTAPRGLAIDADNNLWAGTWSSSKYYYVDGDTGNILKTVDVAPWNHHAYGAVIDGNGVLWSSGQERNHVLRLDPAADPPAISTLSMGHFVYGLGVDYLNHLFASAWTDNGLARVNVSTGVKEWTKPAPNETRGVACTSDNDVWVVSTVNDRVYRYDNNGNLKTSIYVGNGPTGVAVDAAGKVWVCNLGDEYIKRIDPATNTVDLSKPLVGSGGHYTYSDMTGIVARSITTKIGTWTVVFDSGLTDTPWGNVSWNSHEPEGTSVTVRVRSSHDQASWSAWEAVTNGVDLSATPNGRYLQIETTLKITAGEISPILYDLTVEAGNFPPVADADGPYETVEGTPVTLDASGSWDLDGSIILYEWDLDNDGEYDDATGVLVDALFGDDGTFTVGLRVTDDCGATDTDTAQVVVHNVAPALTLDTSSAIPFAGGDAFFGRKGVEQTHHASATDPGSDDLTFSWNLGATTTYFNDGLGPDPFPSPWGVFPFVAADAASVTFDAPGVYLVAVTVADDDGGSDSDELPKLVTGDGDCTRTQGFWKHQFGLKGKHHIDDPTLEAYLGLVNFASAVFSEQSPASTLAEAREVMWASGPDMRDKAEAQLLAAWLNFANGAVGWAELIDTDGDDVDDMPFYQVVSAAEAILLDADASHAQLVHAKDLAEAVNTHDEDNPACR